MLVRAGARRHLVLGNIFGKLGNKPSGQAQKWQRVVHYPRSTIYEAVSSVGDYSKFLPWCISSRVLSRELDVTGAGTLTTEMGVGFDSGPMPMRSTFRSTVTLEPLTRVHAVSEPNEFIDSLVFSWEFAPIGERSTKLDLQLEFRLKSGEHALLWELAQDKVIHEYVRCFSKRCVELESEAAQQQRPESSN